MWSLQYEIPHFSFSYKYFILILKTLKDVTINLILKPSKSISLISNLKTLHIIFLHS